MLGECYADGSGNTAAGIMLESDPMTHLWEGL